MSYIEVPVRVDGPQGGRVCRLVRILEERTADETNRLALEAAKLYGYTNPELFLQPEPKVATVQLTVDECGMLGEALAGQIMRYEDVINTMKQYPSLHVPGHLDYMQGRVRDLRNLHVTVINARIKGS